MVKLQCMISRENPIFGRKVFFINPPSVVEEHIIGRLKEHNFEVYSIKNYTYAKPLLRHYNDALCFAFIDNGMSIECWFNYIQSFQYEDDLKTIFLGVLSFTARPDVQQNFLMNLKLPGGFVIIDKDIKKTAATIEGILEINGAKGRRQYMRLNLNDNNEVNGYFTQSTLLYSFRLIDISKVGFAALIPASMASNFKPDSFVHNISITMGRYSFVCTIKVHSVKTSGKSIIMVAFFSDNIKEATKQKIHEYIYETLDKEHKHFMTTLVRDNADYGISQIPVSEQEQKNAEKTIEELDEAVEEAMNSIQKESGSKS